MPAKILKNGTVVTFDDATQSVKVLSSASILIIDDRIAAIGENFDALDKPANVEIVDVSGKIVTPGFVNTHVHMWQTAYRSIAPEVTLVEYFNWLSQTAQGSVKSFTPDNIYISSLEGFLEGLNAGVTSFVDHAHNDWNPDVIESGYDAAVDSGARVWWCPEPSERQECTREEQWKVIKRVAAREQSRLVPLGLAYQDYTRASAEDFAYVGKMIKELKLEALTVHHLGGPWPSLKSSPVELAESNIQSFGIPMILSHAPYLTPEDMQAMRQHNFHVSTTPESEFHYGHGQTTAHHIMDQASLGVDTTFTFSGDILTQARMWLQRTRDVLFQKLIQEKDQLPRATPMTVEQAFLLATRQGGKSLWRDDIGVIQVGAKADLVVFNGDSPNMLGWSNAVAAVMLHANVGDIEHVLVGGEFRKKDSKLVGMKYEWEEVKKRFVETAKKVQKGAFPPPPVPENLWGFKDTGVPDVASTVVKK